MSVRESSFSLRIFVLGGEFEGLRLVEKSNWNGRGLVCPRATFPKAKARPEFSRTGVYVLSGPEEEGAQLKIYIGEGDPSRDRLEQHYAKKDSTRSSALPPTKRHGLRHHRLTQRI
jgi:hypothetical protein